MAKGRMLNRSISRDRDVAELANTVGVDAALLFTWMIPHLDRDGRMDADPEVVKGLVVPKLAHFTSGVVSDLLRSLSGTRMVRIYDDGRGCRFAVFPGFAKNQTGFRYDREAVSEFPDPGECTLVSGPTPDLLRSNAGVVPDERKGKEQKGTDGEGERKDLSGSAPDLVLIPDAPPPKREPDGTEEVWARYAEHHPRAKLGDKERRAIRARLREGSTVADLCQAIDGYHRSPFHTGENDRGAKYLDATLIFRDASHVAKGIELATAADDPVLSVQTKRNIRAGDAWLAMMEKKDAEKSAG
jgi:transposase-like protein